MAQKVIKKAKIKPYKKSKVPYVIALQKSQLQHFDSIEKKIWFQTINK